jgi:hypothetical protein
MLPNVFGMLPNRGKYTYPFRYNASAILCPKIKYTNKKEVAERRNPNTYNDNETIFS